MEKTWLVKILQSKNHKSALAISKQNQLPALAKAIDLTDLLKFV